MDYSQLISEIKRYYPNTYRRHYKEYMEQGSFWARMNLAEGLAHEVNEHFVDMQHAGYKASEQPHPVQLLPSRSSQAIDKLVDFALANDHFRGLTLRREANGQTRVDEDFPPLGEGAREYHNREWVAGVPISVAERRRTKVCEGCHAPFIDKSRAKNAKVCGDTCRVRKDALRKRAEYNSSELGLQSEMRLKRYRDRQQSEYPFYSPYEMSTIGDRSERAYEERKIDRQAYKKDENYEAGPDASPMANFVRFEGRRKPMYVGRDEFSQKPFNYCPRGRNPKPVEENNGPVIVRNLSEIKDEDTFKNADNFGSEWWVEVNSGKGFAHYTSEVCAIR
ncbi:hypothetical protein ACFRH9_28330 [Peribacillus butanolivorans]|uniref:hypothetical protein n=1 Tax=Peribacillus butanolivorans TaxID=421767 RepID=UPI0036729132